MGEHSRTVCLGTRALRRIHADGCGRRVVAGEKDPMARRAVRARHAHCEHAHTAPESLRRRAVRRSIPRDVLGKHHEVHPGMAIPLHYASGFFSADRRDPIVCSLFILLAAKYYKHIAPTQLAAGIIFFFLFAKSIRMGPLFVITAIPVIYGGLTYASAAFSSGWRLLTQKVKMVIKGIGAAVSIGMLCLVLAVPAALGETQITAAQYPAAAVNFLNHSAAQGNKIVLLNTYIWGGYLIWAAPTIKVFIDGRMPHWIAPDGVSAMGDYIKLLLTPVAPDAQLAILKKWGVNTVLISFQDATSGNAGFVATLKSAGWVITYHDATAVILQYRP